LFKAQGEDEKRAMFETVESAKTSPITDAASFANGASWHRKKFNKFATNYTNYTND